MNLCSYKVGINYEIPYLSQQLGEHNLVSSKMWYKALAIYGLNN